MEKYYHPPLPYILLFAGRVSSSICAVLPSIVAASIIIRKMELSFPVMFVNFPMIDFKLNHASPQCARENTVGSHRPPSPSPGGHGKIK